MNLAEEEGSVDSGNNVIREEGPVYSGSKNNREERENPAQSENTTPPPDEQENQQIHQEEQITPKLPLYHPSIPKKVTFMQGLLDSTMENRAQASGRGEQENRLAAFETIYRTLIDQHISPELATLAASKVLNGTQPSGPRYTSTPHSYPNQQLAQQAPSCTTITQNAPLGSQQNSIPFHTETKMTQNKMSIAELRLGK